MWELDCEESWVPKNWCFWTVVLEKTLESPLDFKEIQPVHPEGDQPWVFIERTDAKAETPILWPPHAKSWLIGKDSDAGRDGGQQVKGTTEDEMAVWHHWLDGHEFEWTPGVGLGCCDSWGRKESDTTEWLNWTGRFLGWEKKRKQSFQSLYLEGHLLEGSEHHLLILCMLLSSLKGNNLQKKSLSPSKYHQHNPLFIALFDWSPKGSERTSAAASHRWQKQILEILCYSGTAYFLLVVFTWSFRVDWPPSSLFCSPTVYTPTSNSWSLLMQMT